jgi:hypothetical protein
MSLSSSLCDSTNVDITLQLTIKIMFWGGQVNLQFIAAHKRADPKGDSQAERAFINGRTESVVWAPA